MLGHYDPPHNAIVISRILDRPGTPRLAVEYVMYHEMLHLNHPAEHREARGAASTRGAFKMRREAVRKVPEAQALLRKLP